MSIIFQKIMLEEIGQIVTGKTPSSNVIGAFSSSGIPFVTPKDMDGRRWIETTERYLSEAGRQSLKNYLIPKDSVAVSCIGSDMGKAILLKKDSVTNQQINTIIVDASKHNPKYIYYVLSLKQEELKSIAGGSATPILNKGHFSKVVIELPDKVDQDNIVQVLDSLDCKIELNNQTNQTLESIAQALFKSWFIDFEPVRAKIEAKQNGEDPELAAMCAISGKSETELKQMPEDDFAELQATAALFPAELMESELGKVPNGWLPVNIEYFIELIYGKALKKTERIHGVYPVYGSGGLTGWHNKALVKGPGVIIGRKGTIGSIFLENKDFYPIDTTYYVKTKNNCSLLFAYYLLQTLGLEKMNTDAAVPGLNRQNFYHLEVPFYSSDLIEKYTKTIENIISKNLSIKKENEYLIGMRDSLLPKLLSGEVALGDVIDG
nr:restriction endonuclease subunit S [Acinetobacter cumulans]